MGIFFTILRHLTELWVSFSGDFSKFTELWPRFSFDFRNYDPKIHQNLRNYGYQFFGQNGTSPSDDRSRYPPPPRVKSFSWMDICYRLAVHRSSSNEKFCMSSHRTLAIFDNHYLDCVHTMPEHFENGEKIADRPPVHTKTAYLCRQISKTIDFEKRNPNRHILETASCEHSKK